MFAAFKAGLVPVNTNYRYVDDELVYLWDNADAVAVSSTAPSPTASTRSATACRRCATGSGSTTAAARAPTGPTPYEDAVATPTERVVAPWGRSGDDITMLYTGGTTGMPKGVMWRQDDLIRAVHGVANPLYLEDPETVGIHSVIDAIPVPGAPGLPACPLMHGTGWFTANLYLTAAGSVVLLESRHFDVDELLDTVEREKVGAITIVGDAFAKPIVRALDAEPDRWDISSLVLITSSGVMWSEGAKQGLLRHHAGMLLIDAFSSSEAIGMGSSVSAAGAEERTAHVHARRRREGVHRRRATRSRPAPASRAGSPSRATFPSATTRTPRSPRPRSSNVDGKRYSIPGDYATVEADGTITLLGRGSVCINTGGEKVFPEEVEEALKTHASVARRGRRRRARREVRRGDHRGRRDRARHHTVDEELIAHVKGTLAPYKAPKTRALHRHHRARPQRQGRLQATQAVRAGPARHRRLIAPVDRSTRRCSLRRPRPLAHCSDPGRSDGGN